MTEFTVYHEEAAFLIPLFVKHIFGFRILQLNNNVLFVSSCFTKKVDVDVLRLPSIEFFAFLLLSPH